MGMANQISDLFFAEGGADAQISWQSFKSKLHTPAMLDYFKTIDVDPSEGQGLFDLLDADDSGTVDASEMVNGFLKLRGPAKALDIALLMREFGSIKLRLLNTIASSR